MEFINHQRFEAVCDARLDRIRREVRIDVIKLSLAKFEGEVPNTAMDAWMVEG